VFTEEQKRLLNKLCAIDDIESGLSFLLNESRKNVGELREVGQAISKLVREKTEGFPWLADAIAQYYELRDLKIAEFLKKKLRPALSSAERVREIAKEKRILEKKYRIARNLVKYYEALFPWLREFVGEDLDELIKQVSAAEWEKGTEEDPARFFLTRAEYEKLSSVERNQKALDRYWQKKKTSWELGRDYERYVGYLYEREGYAVYYQGIMDRLEDLGRDLVARKGKKIEVIQCKYWSQNKTIHENHICQLFGTTVKYWIENQKRLRKELRIQQDLFSQLVQKKLIRGVFITSTSLSKTAREFASELNIDVKEQFLFQKYPSIKCNISRRKNEKIYHLPFDQQYDRTLVEQERTECYVETVREAEDLGFRRAFRWRGESNKKNLQGENN